MPIIFENAFSKKFCKKILKAESTLLDKARIGKENIVGVFDDRQKVVDMWRKNGLTCFQVADGNF